MTRTLTRLALLLAIAGCGGGGGNESPPDLLPPPPDLAIPPYPSGPYGIKEGDTLYDVTAKGYHLSRMQTDSSKLMLEDVKVSEAHFNPACKCLVVSISAEWCPPCNAEQTPMIEALNADPSLCAFEVLLENIDKKKTQQADLDRWTQKYQHNFPVVLPQLAATLHLPPASALPTNLTVHPDNMKIEKIFTGFNAKEEITAKALCNLK